MSKARKREARKSLKRPGWITLEGGFAARPCVVRGLVECGREDHASGSQYLAGAVAAGFRARRQIRPQLRSGVGQGQIRTASSSCGSPNRPDAPKGPQMPSALIAIILTMLSASVATAAQSGRKPVNSTTSGRLHPTKGAGPDNSCVVYGAGFARVDGTDTCVSIGGAVSIGVGGSGGHR